MKTLNDCYPEGTDLRYFDDAPRLPRENVEADEISMVVKVVCGHCLDSFGLDPFDFTEQEEGYDCEHCGQPLQVILSDSLWDLVEGFGK